MGLGDATGFLVAQLTGRAVMDHATTVDHCCAGLKQVVPLPEILKADAVAGGLTSAAARRLGLAAGTPVTVGTYDSFADLAGAGVLADGDRGLLLGSTVVIGRISKKPPTPAAAAKAGLRITPHAGEGSFVGGWTSTSGTALNWARVEFGQGTQHPQMPGASGLLALPYLAGERAPIWDIDARGALLGFTLETDKQHLATAMTEGVVLSILDIASRLDGLTSVASGYRVSGGGLRNKVWADAMADALGVPLEVMENAGEAIGPAALAFRALGVDRKARIAWVVKPDRKRHARYQELLRIYRTLYPALKTAMHDLGRLAKEDQEHA